MEPITMFATLVATLEEAGPWVALAAGAISLYIMQVRRNTKLEDKLDKREDAFRKLLITMTSVNVKNQITLGNIKDALVQNQASANKTEARLHSVEDRVKVTDTKMDEAMGRLVELCTHARVAR